VSVLLPTRNGETGIAAAIQSVLDQTYRNLELVVVDDGSTDRTATLLDSLAARDPRLRVIGLDAPVGLQRALNTGLANARGSLIARIDDDDLWIKREKLATQIAMIQSSQSLQLLGTGCEMYDPETGVRFVREQPTGDHDIRRVLLSWNPFVHSSVMFYRNTALACGGYSESCRHVEDYDLWLRLGLRGELANLPDVCVRYRISPRVGPWSQRRRTWWEQLQLIRRYHRSYPGVGRALASSAARLCVQFLPVGRTGRTWLRSVRRR
jgi:glycosyltransferase involved in cell wall biosynthesis